MSLSNSLKAALLVSAGLVGGASLAYGQAPESGGAPAGSAYEPIYEDRSASGEVLSRPPGAYESIESSQDEAAQDEAAGTDEGPTLGPVFEPVNQRGRRLDSDTVEDPAKQGEALLAPISIVPGGAYQRPRVGPGAAPSDAQEPVGPDPFAQTRPAPQQSGGFETGAGDASAIEVQELSGIDPAGIGALGPSEGGFGREMWRGLDRSAAVGLISALPAQKLSPSLRNLQKRLLLSEARVPEPARTERTAPDPYLLLRSRVDRLSAIGDLPGLEALFERLPSGLRDMALTRRRVDAGLLNGNVASACQEAEQANERDSDPYWFQVVTFCRAVNGDRDGASFAIDILRDSGVQDRVYFRLLQALMAEEGAEKPTISGLGTPTPLKLAMLRAAQIAMPVDALAGASPLMLRAAATSPNMANDLRIEAALLAAEAGAIDGELLGQILEGAQVSDSDLRNADVLATASSTGRAYALLYQSALRSQGVSQRYTNLRRLWQRARDDGLFLLIARASRPISEAVPVDASDSAKAVEMVRALAAAGAVQRLQEWLTQIDTAGQSLGNPVSSARDQLMPYRLLLSGARSGLNTADLQAWWNSWGGEPEVRARRADMAFAILEAVGFRVPESAWHQVLGASGREEVSMPSLAVWRGMINAGANNQMGLGVASVLVALGPDSPASSHPALVSNAILALRSLGMEREARLLGLEALAASD